VADELQKIAGALQSTYMVKTGKSEKEVKKWMNEDTWFSAQEALDAGLADEVTDSVKMAANANLATFKNLPTALKPFAETPEPDPKPAPVTEPEPAAPAKTAEEIAAEEAEAAHQSAKNVENAQKAGEKRARDILAACTDAGVPEAAASFLDRGLSADEVKSKLADATKIRARCLAARLPDRANNYIKAGMSVKEVADDLFDVLIARQGPEIDNKLAPEAERRTEKTKPTSTAAEIYALRRKQQK
jgi:hypothetical protein